MMTITKRPKRQESKELVKAMKAATKEKLTRVGIYAPVSLHEKIKVIAAKKHTTISALMCALAENEVLKHFGD